MYFNCFACYTVLYSRLATTGWVKTFTLQAEMMPLYQGCGSGSGLDPDSVTLWIRIRIGNPDPGSGSRGKKVKKFQRKTALYSYFSKKSYH
jgi:hypothetical protein